MDSWHFFFVKLCWRNVVFGTLTFIYFMIFILILYLLIFHLHVLLNLLSPNFEIAGVFDIAPLKLHQKATLKE
jgi:hypothetical protein